MLGKLGESCYKYAFYRLSLGILRTRVVHNLLLLITYILPKRQKPRCTIAVDGSLHSVSSFVSVPSSVLSLCYGNSPEDDIQEITSSK